MLSRYFFIAVRLPSAQRGAGSGEDDIDSASSPPWRAEPPYHLAVLVKWITCRVADHDDLAATQVGTYTQMRARLFTHRLAVGGPVVAGLAAATVARLAHCHVYADRVDHFTGAQARVWNPGMAAAPDLTGGAFAQYGTQSSWSCRCGGRRPATIATR